MYKILILLIILITFTGCVDDHQIVDELAVILAMSFDSEPEEENLITLTTSNPLFAEEAEDPIRVMSVQGYGVSGALDNWQKHRNRTIALGKVETMLFGETLSEENLSQIVQDIRKIPEVNANALVSYYPGEARDVLYEHPPEDGRIAIFLKDMLEVGATDHLIPRITLHDLWTAILTEGRDGFLPIIDLKVEGEIETPFIAGVAVLDEEGNIATTLEDEKGKLLTNMLFRETSPSLSSNISIEGNEGLVKYTIQSSSIDFNVDYNDKEVSVTIEKDVTVNIDELQIPGVEIVDEEIFDLISDLVAKDFVNNTQRILEKLQEYESDPLGIGRHVRIQQQEYYTEDTWRNDYPDITIDNDYTVSVVRGNTLIETFDTD
ncbi:Ger(x)C family spore germination protein [Natranaerobius trueperi]|uniref:Uncharacterized protein n=1 Tax=Natranaerobius trueperi TaxID=759412 RepID=A0A226BXQ5_9FIRM|nr:Ger(x)C family spore germination protein [Natranaerobius trueperi]OWZ83701.1 hypothetical protein CDO51_07040 [Natranaerobius trueperi]